MREGFPRLIRAWRGGLQYNRVTMAEPQALGGMLGQEALRRGISQAQAADAIGVSQATFSRWVAGTTPPSARYWTAIGRFLRISRADVMRHLTAELDTRSRNYGERIAALEAELADVKRILEEIRRRQDH